MKKTQDPATTRSIDELVDHARHQGRDDASTTGAHAALGAHIWAPSAAATEAMLGLADHSAALDEPGRYGTARVDAAVAATRVERGLGTIRASIADLYGATQRLITLRHAVGHNWHRRIQVEHTAVLTFLIVTAIAAEAVFASTAARAVGLYDLWQQLLFGTGAAIAYLGIGAFIGRALVPDTEIRPTDATASTTTGDASGSPSSDPAERPHHDPIITGRRHRTPTGTKVLIAALALWILGTTGLTILRESYAQQEAAAQRADRATARQELDQRTTTGDTAIVDATDGSDTHNPLVDGLAMWCIAAMIGAGITFLEATRSDPVVREWHDTTHHLDRTIDQLGHHADTLTTADLERSQHLEALRNHHDGLRHRTTAHHHLAHAQALAHTQHATPAADDATTPAPTTAEIDETTGHGEEIRHHLANATATDATITATEHHLALALTLANTARGIHPYDAEIERAIALQLHTWLTTAPGAATPGTTTPGTTTPDTTTPDTTTPDSAGNDTTRTISVDVDDPDASSVGERRRNGAEPVSVGPRS